MWCLVSQPNTNKDAFSSVVIEVRVGNKATGQECLNQVIKLLISSFVPNIVLMQSLSI